MTLVKKGCFLTLITLAGVMSVSAWAQLKDDAIEIITKNLKQANPDIEFSTPRPSPIQGVYAVQFRGGPMVYVGADGKHMFVGDLMSITPAGFARYEDPVALEERKRVIAAINPKDSIIFKPKTETRKVVYVFTDVDCGYCRKLHSQINGYSENGRTFPGYNDLGIEIRYLAFPRAGEESGSAKKLQNAWCADNPQDALTKLKNNQSVPTKTCTNPVVTQYRLGGELGVSGTPSMFTLDGQVIPGYIPPIELAEKLGL
jgi:thiol:disulfide interchange protein DsbC